MVIMQVTKTVNALPTHFALEPIQLSRDHDSRIVKGAHEVRMVRFEPVHGEHT